MYTFTHLVIFTESWHRFKVCTQRMLWLTLVLWCI